MFSEAARNIFERQIKDYLSQRGQKVVKFHFSLSKTLFLLNI